MRMFSGSHQSACSGRVKDSSLAAPYLKVISKVGQQIVGPGVMQSLIPSQAICLCFDFEGIYD